MGKLWERSSCSTLTSPTTSSCPCPSPSSRQLQLHLPCSWSTYRTILGRATLATSPRSPPGCVPPSCTGEPASLPPTHPASACAALLPPRWRAPRSHPCPPCPPAHQKTPCLLTTTGTRAASAPPPPSPHRPPSPSLVSAPALLSSS